MAAFIAEDNEVAAERFQAAIAADEALGHAHYLLGLTWSRLGRTEAAAGALRQAIAVTDNDALRDYARAKLARIQASPPADAGP